MGASPSEPTQGHFFRRIAPGVVAVVLVAYPVLVYTAIKATTVRFASLLLLFCLAPIVLNTNRSLGAKRPMAVGLMVVGLLAVAGLVDSIQPLLFIPVAVNSSFLLAFGHSLLVGPPIIERFARFQHPDLTTAEIKWCKQWTVTWCTFFGLNIAVAGLLAVLQELAWWTLYNGLISYFIMGSLFSIEYVARKYRFGRLSRRPWDRLLAITFERLCRRGKGSSV